MQLAPLNMNSKEGAQDDMEKLFTPREAAEYLKVHVETLRRYVREGQLQAVKVGGRLRIQESDLIKFVKREGK